jgi:hypothetical protein
MKKSVVLLMLLGMVVTANAGLKIVIWDGMFWVEYADSKITIAPSDELLIGVLDLGGPVKPGTLAMGISSNGGLGSLDVSDVRVFQNVTANVQDDAVAAAELGILNPFLLLNTGTYNPNSMLMRNTVFHCEGPGDVTLVLVDYETGEVVDTQVIHQIPEPMTVAVLGLGGLAIVMSKKR